MIQDSVTALQSHASTDTWVGVMSSIAASVNVFAIAYARHRGKKRDPLLQKLNERLGRIEKRLGIDE